MRVGLGATIARGAAVDVWTAALSSGREIPLNVDSAKNPNAEMRGQLAVR
jgi:hypothetical protein